MSKQSHSNASVMTLVSRPSKHKEALFKSTMEDYLSFNHREITIIRRTWANNVVRSEAVNTLPKTHIRATLLMLALYHFWQEVYDQLLGENPKLHNVLPSIKHQTTSFLGIVYTAIMNLENLSVMNDFLDSLGRKHSRVFGAEPVYFEYLGTAFINTLSERLGEDSTPEVEAAWIKLYCFLLNLIIFSGNTDPMVLNNKDDDFNTFMAIRSNNEDQYLSHKSQFNSDDSASDTLAFECAEPEGTPSQLKKSPSILEFPRPKRHLFSFKLRIKGL